MAVALIAIAIALVSVLWIATIRKPVHRMADYEPIPAEIAQRQEWTEHANR